jgi:hypothetical protein
MLTLSEAEGEESLYFAVVGAVAFRWKRSGFSLAKTLANRKKA